MDLARETTTILPPHHLTPRIKFGGMVRSLHAVAVLSSALAAFSSAALLGTCSALAFHQPSQALQLGRASGVPRVPGSLGHVGAADGHRGTLASHAAAPVLSLRGGSSASMERFSFPGRNGVAAVSIAGDWNAWVAAPLVLGEDGVWAVEMSMAEGEHKYKYVINGNDWVCSAPHALWSWIPSSASGDRLCSRAGAKPRTRFLRVAGMRVEQAGQIVHVDGDPLARLVTVRLNRGRLCTWKRGDSSAVVSASSNSTPLTSYPTRHGLNPGPSPLDPQTLDVNPGFRALSPKPFIVFPRHLPQHYQRYFQRCCQRYFKRYFQRYFQRYVQIDFESLIPKP